jgi:preprotein translocase subunit YajC
LLKVISNMKMFINIIIFIVFILFVYYLQPKSEKDA